MNDFASDFGDISNYFGFPVTNLETLYSDSKKNQPVVECLEGCYNIIICSEFESL